MKILNFTFFIFFIFLAASCSWGDVEDQYNDECDDPDYSDCQTLEPREGALIIKVTINNENRYVPLEIYRDNIDDGMLIANDTATTNEHEFFVTLDRYYSVVAKYKVGEKTILAVNGDRINKSSSNYCDSTCWNISGGKINVTIKE